jgi:hypothetical protein
VAAQHPGDDLAVAAQRLELGEHGALQQLDGGVRQHQRDPTVSPDRAVCGTPAGERARQGRLAGAGRPVDQDDLALANREVEGPGQASAGSLEDEPPRLEHHAGPGSVGRRRQPRRSRRVGCDSAAVAQLEPAPHRAASRQRRSAISADPLPVRCSSSAPTRARAPRVEVRGRLVEQQRPGAGEQRRWGHPLALAARQRRRAAVEEQA